MRNFLILFLAGMLNVGVIAAGKSETVSTNVRLEKNPDYAKGAQLRAKADTLVAMVSSKRLAEAERLAGDLCPAYEATFDHARKQFTFQSQAEHEEFKRTKPADFEWIDWGYKECLQMQAFIAADRRDFPAALTLLNRIEALAPVSAGTVVETGYVLNQIGRPDEGLAAYRRARDMAFRYASQRPFRAMALRGMGFSLIELQRLDEAEKLFRESLDIEPGNKVAINELAYIRDQRGAR